MTRRILLASTALILGCSAAQVIGASAACAAPAYTLSQDHSIMSVSLAEHARLEAGVVKPGGGGVLNNLADKYKNGLYWCCEGASVSGPLSGIGDSFTDAVAFVPSTTKSVTRITLGIGIVSGTNSVTVSLYSDDSGEPGTAIVSHKVKNLPEGFTCCGTVTATIPSTPLQSGTQYWVVISASGTTAAVWNSSTVDQVDNHTSAYQKDGGQWTIVNNGIVWSADVR